MGLSCVSREGTKEPFRLSRSLRVGISGHRFLADIERVAAGVEQALDGIQSTFGAQRMVALSSLAEGADRLVASRILARPGSRLVAVLPLTRQDYLADFTSPRSTEEFLFLCARAAEVITMPTGATHLTAYQLADRYVLEHCDVLLAVWDGQAAQGPGGTATVVQGARHLGLPLAWVHAGNRVPGSNTPTSQGSEQGRVTYERFTHPTHR